MEEKNLYFYHPDHLGSSSYITNKDGEVIQHTEYMAFGETFVDEHSVNPRQPYLFNGKELDYETGLYYYGARYYDPKVSLWLNTDPLSGYNPILEIEHYIDGQHNGGVFNHGNLNTYTYTYQNPVVFVDPNGKQAYFMTPPNTHMKGNSTILPAKARTLGFAIRNPWYATRIGQYERGSDNISSIATRFGTTGGILKLNKDSKGNTFDEGSERGAFRHAVWQALITSEFGENIAKQAGNAHEENPNIDLSIRIFDNLAEADQTADLLNNIIGREMGKKSSNVVETVLEEYKNNGLYQINQNTKTKKWEVSKHKLSKEQYLMYKERLKNMNYKGRTIEEQKARDGQ